MSTSKRITCTLPADLVVDLDRVSYRMNITRSALVATVLKQTISPLASIIDLLPPEGSEVTEATVKRFRGDSARIISDQITNLLLDEGQHDLFKS